MKNLLLLLFATSVAAQCNYAVLRANLASSADTEAAGLGGGAAGMAALQARLYTDTCNGFGGFAAVNQQCQYAALGFQCLLARCVIVNGVIQWDNPVPCRLQPQSTSWDQNLASGVVGGVPAPITMGAVAIRQDNDLPPPYIPIVNLVKSTTVYAHTLVRPCDSSYTEANFISDVKEYTDINVLVVSWACASINVRFQCTRVSSRLTIADEDCVRLKALLTDCNTRISKVTRAHSTCTGSGDGGLWALFALLLLPVCLIGFLCCFKGRKQRDGVKEIRYPPQAPPPMQHVQTPVYVAQPAYVQTVETTQYSPPVQQFAPVVQTTQYETTQYAPPIVQQQFAPVVQTQYGPPLAYQPQGVQYV